MTPYDLLFADQPLEELLTTMDFKMGGQLAAARARLWEGDTKSVDQLTAKLSVHWANFIAGAAHARVGRSPVRIRAIAEDAFQEARVRAWAWTELRRQGEQPQAMFANEVLGIVAEIPVDDGFDVLATYADGSSRFLSHADHVIVREAAEAEKEETAVLSAAAAMLSIPPSIRDPQDPPLKPDQLRFTTISPQGLHREIFGWDAIAPDARYNQLFNDLGRLLVKVTNA